MTQENKEDAGILWVAFTSFLIPALASHDEELYLEGKMTVIWALFLNLLKIDLSLSRFPAIPRKRGSRGERCLLSVQKALTSFRQHIIQNSELFHPARKSEKTHILLAGGKPSSSRALLFPWEGATNGDGHCNDCSHSQLQLAERMDLAAVRSLNGG